MRKTKIICTLGPSTDKEGVLRDLIANGMNVARFNFSHGSHEEHLGRFEKLKAIREELGKPVAALLDTKGPEIRLKDFKNGVENLVAGQTFTLTTRDVEGTNEICSITYKDLPMDVEPNGTIMLDDGLIKLQIITVNDTDIVCKVLSRNVISAGIRNLPGFSMGTVSGDCWQNTARMQVSYDNILEWLYSLCETIGGSANVRLDGNALKCDLFSGTDRSLLQDENPHIVFSDAYNNLLSFSYAADDAVQKNFAYVLGCGEGNARKRTTFCSGAEPTYLDRYEVYVDERNTAQEEDVTDTEYLEILKSSGAEHLVQPKTALESAIAAFSTQYQYNKDYFVGDYVTVEQKRFGLIQPRIQLIGMVESFDQNGRSLTPTFKEME